MTDRRRMPGRRVRWGVAALLTVSSVGGVGQTVRAEPRAIPAGSAKKVEGAVRMYSSSITDYVLDTPSSVISGVSAIGAASCEVSR